MLDRVLSRRRLENSTVQVGWYEDHNEVCSYEFYYVDKRHIQGRSEYPCLQVSLFKGDSKKQKIKGCQFSSSEWSGYYQRPNSIASPSRPIPKPIIQAPIPFCATANTVPSTISMDEGIEAVIAIFISSPYPVNWKFTECTWGLG